MTTTRTIDVRPDLPINLSDGGSGSAALVLHGGGGPATVEPIGTHLAETHRALTPTHPGWNGTVRPAWLTRIADVASVYLDLLHELAIDDVLVVGSSIGGWIAAEMAVRDRREQIARLVIIDSAGVDVPGQPIRDFFALDARGSPTTRITTGIASTPIRRRSLPSSSCSGRPTWRRCDSSPVTRTCTIHRCSGASATS